MRIPTVLLAVALAILIASPARAQTPQNKRPYRGLFGGGVGDTSQLLTLNLSLGGGYDTKLLVGGNSGGTNGVPTSQIGATNSSSGISSLGFNYLLDRSRVGLTASVAGVASYYPKLANPLVARYSGNAGGRFELWSGARVTANETIASDPSYLLFLPTSFALPAGLGGPISPGSSGSVILENRVTAAGTVGFSQAVSSRVTLSASYGADRSDSPSHARDLSINTVRGGVGVSLTKGLGLRLGYGQADGAYGAGAGTQQPIRNRSIDGGINFNRALSLTRSTTLSFGTGTVAASDTSRTVYRVLGNVRVNQEIGRTWNAALVARRDMDFLDTFKAPVFSDSLGVDLEGLVNRRLQWRSGAGVSSGTVGLGSASSRFTTRYGATALGIGLTRFFGLSLDYSYVHYAFGAGVVLPTGVPPRMDRQSIRAQLTVWAPLFYTARRPNASR